MEVCALGVEQHVLENMTSVFPTVHWVPVWLSGWLEVDLDSVAAVFPSDRVGWDPLRTTEFCCHLVDCLPLLLQTKQCFTEI